MERKTSGPSRDSSCCQMKSNVLHENPASLWSLLSLRSTMLLFLLKLLWYFHFLFPNEESQQWNMPGLLSPTANANPLLAKQNWIKKRVLVKKKVIVKVLCMMNTFCQFHYHKSVSCNCALVYVLASCSVIPGYMHAFILQILDKHLPQAQNSACLGLSSPI